VIHLDTHAVVWLYMKDEVRFTEKGKSLIDREDLIISPMVKLEIEYLYEVDKISERSSIIIEYLMEKIDLNLSDIPLDRVIEKAQTMKWTGDPFDRIITAQALLQDAALLTKDRTILKHYSKAFW